MRNNVAKRVWAVLLVCLIVTTLLPVTALAASVSTKNLKSFDKNFYVLKGYSSKYLYNQYNYSRFVKNGKNVGCTATSEAIACSITWDTSIKPSNTKYIGWSSGGATWLSSSVVTQKSASDQLKKIGEQIQKGNAVVVRANASHSVAAIGLRKGANVDKLQPKDILIADPATGATTTLNNAQPNGYKYQGASGTNSGWSLMVPNSAKKPQSSGSQTTSGSYTAVVTASSGLNLRTGPGTGYSVYKAVPKGTKLTVIGSSGDWAKISYNGKTLYCSAQYLKKA